MSRIFLTGGSGFLGSWLLPALVARGATVVALDRSGSLAAGEAGAGIEVVPGDVRDARSYRAVLESTPMVVHLAALTGRASAKEHFEVNLHGTEVLLEECRRAGVERFLFVSSIAAKFPQKPLYHYAQAKELAEQAVRDSDLAFTIVRPTIVLGRGSGPLLALCKLAGLPVFVVFGDGRTRVQPVFVEDLVGFLMEIIERRPFQGEVIELGGPSELSIEDLLRAIRWPRGNLDAKALHIPLPPVFGLLAVAERLRIPGLPLTAGQLCSFRCDGTIEPSDLHESRRAKLRTVPEMLSLSLWA